MAGPSKQSESTSPENPFFFQKASGQRTSTLAILPMKDLSQIILLCTDRAGEKVTLFTLGGGIAMMRQEPSMTSPLELVTMTLFSFCQTDLTKKFSLIYPPLFFTSSLRKMLICWVPLDVFFSWRPFLTVIKFQKSLEQRTQYNRQRKLTSESSTPKMTLRAPSIITLVFMEVRFSSIQDWTVIESHLAAIKQSPGFYGTFFAILFSFIRVNCISINEKIFPMLGISPVYVQFPSLRCIIFLPLSSTGMRSFLDSKASSMAWVWVGPMNCAPRSKLTSLITDVLVLPPTQSLASRTVTLHSTLLRSSRAAVSPERPAPTMITLRPEFSSDFISCNDKLHLLYKLKFTYLLPNLISIWGRFHYDPIDAQGLANVQ